MDLPRSHPKIVEESRCKRDLVRALLEARNLDAVILTRRDQFAWITTGGDSAVIENTESSVGYLLITRSGQYLVGHRMDGQRLLDEQLPGQEYEPVTLRWFDPGFVQTCRRLVGSGRIAADAAIDGLECLQDTLVDLHYPMTELEVARYRWLGQATAGMMAHMADFVRPGQTEQEIAAEMRIEHIRRGLDVDVLIVGSDERVFRYRHPMPTTARLERYVMLHSAVRRWGLHANVTRFVHFGPLPARIRRIYDAAAAIQGRILLRLSPGLPFARILEWQKLWYQEFGFPDEWHNHFQGGPTGYVIADATRCQTSKTVQVNQPYEWFITITGTKAGELIMLTERGAELLSASREWPEMIVHDGGRVVAVPDIRVMQEK